MNYWRIWFAALVALFSVVPMVHAKAAMHHARIHPIDGNSGTAKPPLKRDCKPQSIPGKADTQSAALPRPQGK